MPLLRREDSVLVVIDLQPELWGDRLDPADKAEVDRCVVRASWLVAAAKG